MRHPIGLNSRLPSTDALLNPAEGQSKSAKPTHRQTAGGPEPGIKLNSLQKEFLQRFEASREQRGATRSLATSFSQEASNEAVKADAPSHRPRPSNVRKLVGR